MKFITSIIVFFLFKSGSCFSAAPFVPLSSVQNSYYEKYLEQVLKSANTLAELDSESEYENLSIQLERIGLRLGVALKLGSGPFSIKGEMQHRFIFKLP